MMQVGNCLAWVVKRSLFPVVLLATSFALPASSDSELLRHLRYLASDELKGRGNGSPHLDLASDYIADHFRLYGLDPAAGNSYFQEFDVGLGRGLGPRNRILFASGDQQISLEINKDYIPLSSGAQLRVEGPAVFAGFGISAPELNYDDYRDLDVRGRIVLVFEHEPQEYSKESPFAGTELTPYSTGLYKISNAKSRGAAAIILLPDTFQHPLEETSQARRGEQVEEIGIHGLRLQPGRWERLIQKSGRDFSEIGQWINHHSAPYSFDLGFGVEIWLDLIKVKETIRNVAGLIPGLTDEVVIIGAHYDHLGLGDETSLAQELIGEIHNGADDNASGTAGLLELARQLGHTTPRRGLLFLAFAGEELGLLGSRYYTEHPLIPLEKTVGMLNMDMIGRSKGNLLIGGVETAREFRPLLDALQNESLLRFSYPQSLRGSSDHLPFALKEIPVLFFFSGLHNDYHRPSDDWQKIDFTRTNQILEVVRGIAEHLADVDERPQFVGLRPENHRSRWGGRRGFGPRFGSLIDTDWELDGVRFSQIMADSPAARAGLKDGDVLVQFDKRPVKNLHDFTTRLSRKSPGDIVEVVVVREGQLITSHVRLESNR